MIAYRNHCLSELGVEILDSLKSHLLPSKFGVARTLFRPGDRIRALHFLTSGAVSLVTPLATGQTIEFGLVGRNSVVGGGAALAAGDAIYQAVVQIEGDGYSLDIETARALVRESREFRALMVRHERLILAQAQQSSACNAVHDIEHRFSRWLLRVHDVVGGDTFRLTHEAMSEMLGVRRTSVTAVAQRLQHAGLINYSRGHIKIEDIEGLKSGACECYRSIGAQYEFLPKAREPISAAL